MTNDKTRAEFEKWATGEGFSVVRASVSRHGLERNSYYEDEVCDRWRTWQAATQAARSQSEPVGYITEDAMAMLKAGRHTLIDVSIVDGSFWKYPIYAAPPVQQPIKDHLIAQAINAMRDIAVDFHATQQLRDRLACVAAPLGKGKVEELEQEIHSARQISQAIRARNAKAPVQQPEPELTDDRICEIYRDSFNVMVGRLREAPKHVPPTVLEFARNIAKEVRVAPPAQAQELDAITEYYTDRNRGGWADPAQFFQDMQKPATPVELTPMCNQDVYLSNQPMPRNCARCGSGPCQKAST